ncbi:2Fe-2S iron-sulfur cluster-binding protein [Mameliella alba]|uniref:2Fe-2S iron-sulfur cluster-binding protein n=1 Tax=Mameliella alba TaxID=561184 RepID=UPI000B52B68C|nr:2Fe-2S iron-sulfur cluster-binding protein [Mameliella alba]OWV46317.1 oxidoreductase [Mameliella alba]GGF75456.1 oxidoreductase FAD/NAD(P)-binding domain-containing protein [Mameliella alba]
MADAFRKFRVAARVRESDVITSFHLKPVDGGPLWQAQPGQYLTLRVPTDEGSVLKTYSLSGDVQQDDFHRISVKRECAPDGSEVPDGVGSCWLHDHVQEGEEIEIAPPRGGFVLDQQSERPVLLLAGGVGLTPLLAMAKVLARSKRRVWIFHACENGDVQALGDELRALSDASDGRITLHVAHRQPTDRDRAERRFDSEGLIDKVLLQSLLPLDDYEVYMCGPTPFMVAMYRLLSDLGIARSRVSYEFFGTATSLEKMAAERAPAAKGAVSAPKALANLVNLTDPDAWAVTETTVPMAAESDEAPKGANTVVFSKSGASADMGSDTRTILELAEEAGLEPAFSCRSGICNTCRCTLVEGKVSYVEEPLQAPDAGEVLICCARPEGRVVVDI